MGRVLLHTGNPKAGAPRTTRVSQPRTVDPRTRSAPCTFCGRKATSRSVARRCKRCHGLELVIQGAKGYIASNKLRPLDNSISGTSKAESKHRKAAASAQKTLKDLKVARATPEPSPKSKTAKPSPTAKAERVAELQRALDSLDIRISALVSASNVGDDETRIATLRRRRDRYSSQIAGLRSQQ